MVWFRTESARLAVNLEGGGAQSACQRHAKFFSSSVLPEPL
jgi:hypothetical protein